MTSRALGFLAIVALLIGGGYYLGFAPFVVLGLVGLTVLAISAAQYLFFRTKLDPQQLHIAREITPGPHRIGEEITVGLKISSLAEHGLSEQREDLKPEQLARAARPQGRLKHFSTIESLAPALSLRGSGAAQRAAAAPAPGASAQQVHLGLTGGAGAYRVQPTKRGQWQVGPLSLRWQDAAGFFALTSKHNSYRTVTVWPSVAYLEQLNTSPTAKLQLPDPVSVDVDLREYQPGDDLRNLHWVSSARRGYPVVRHTKAPGPGNLYLVIDLPGDRSTFAPDGDPATVIDTTPSEELLISHACSLALALNDQFQATYVAAQHAFDTESEPATTGEEILNQAALLAPSPSGTEVFSAVLHQLHPLLAPADLVVIAALDSARAAAAIDAFEASSPATTWSTLLVPPRIGDSEEGSLEVLHGNNHTQVKGPLVVKTAEIYGLLSGVDRG